MYNQYCVVRVFLAAGVAILWFGARFALLFGGSSMGNISRVLSAFVNGCRRLIDKCEEHMVGQVDGSSRKNAYKDVERQAGDGVYNSACSWRKLSLSW